MTIRAKLLRGTALAAASVLLLAGCAQSGGSEGGNGGGTENTSGSGTESTSGTSTGATTGIVSTSGSEPEKHLVTYQTSETGGGRILSAMYAGFIDYQADGSTENEMAESFDTEDNQTWTIKIKPGWTFTNGEEITAKTYVDTWTQVAQDGDGAYWLEMVEGVSEDGSTPPTGLKVIDDTTFEVKLKDPQVEFPKRLGYTAYMPLPSVAFEDLDKFGQNPIGNGPYKFEGEGAWEHNVGVKLVANPDYKGNRKPMNGGLDIRFYTDQAAAYADVQGGVLDVIDAVPDTAFKTYQTEFQGRNVNQPAAIFQGINIPYYLDHWKNDEEGKLRRKAISMAINRDEITQTIFDGTRTPATEFSSPVVEGYNDHIKGNDVVKYNPEEAKKLWEQANAISPYSDTFTIAYNADGGHQAWVDAVANSIKNTLGINAEGKSYPDFKTALKDRADHVLTGATRAGWQADFPSQGNFLSGLYQSNAPSNYEQYNNPEFDAKVRDAGKAATTEDAVKIYEEAQQILFDEMPAIPLWYSNVNGVWSDKVDNVKYGWDSVPLYNEITKPE